MDNLPLSERYVLSIKESAAYFNIGIKKMRRLAEENLVFCCGQWESLFDITNRI